MFACADIPRHAARVTTQASRRVKDFDDRSRRTGSTKTTPECASIHPTPAGDNVKVTVDGTDSTGKPAHNEWTGKFDGKDYPVTGDPNSDTQSIKKVDDRALEITVKKYGKVTVSRRVVVSADGKSRTVTTSGTDSKGNKVMSTAVYDKQ
jgi:hypothetical protein